MEEIEELIGPGVEGVKVEVEEVEMEEVEDALQEVEEEVEQDEDVKNVAVDGCNEELEPDGEAEKSAEVLTGAEIT